MKDGSVLVPEVNVQEVEGRNVVVLFATTSAVFRLLLLHPEAISKVIIHIAFLLTVHVHLCMSICKTVLYMYIRMHCSYWNDCG